MPNWEEEDIGGGVVVAKDPKVKRAQHWCVVFYNDDYTTKWFVVDVLRIFFHMDETTASEFMMSVHRKGKGVAGVYTRDIAETKADAIMNYAKENQMPLLVTAEPDADGDEG